ncbi:hypothetical protein HYU40_04855 [Candidatus Woesearchaeota archaeon]|nr:hypothetical protein [Candidatus Woesearchaeota archaeon]
MGYSNTNGHDKDNNGSGRISLNDARVVFAHMRPTVTRNYLLRKGAVLYSSPGSQQPLNGEAKDFNPLQLWVDISDVERAILSITTPSIRHAAQYRLEEIVDKS